MSFGNVGLLIVKGFGNLKQLEHYRQVMAGKGFELPAGVRPIMISKSNFELLLREGRSFEEYFRFEEEEAVERTEQEILDAELPEEPGETGPPEEPDDPDESDESGGNKGPESASGSEEQETEQLQDHG